MTDRKLVAAIATAMVLWFFMFSPWTGDLCNFWLAMSCSAAVLLFLSHTGLKGEPAGAPVRGRDIVFQVVLGIVIAFALWGIFWIGDKLSRQMFVFAQGQIEAVYGMKDMSDPLVIGLLLLFLIGPAEELFWRGYVQRRMSERTGATAAMFITAIVYGLVHIWSFNFMLIMAALVAGGVWGLIYRLKPSFLPALVVSHALWDVLVFVLLPV